MKESTMVRLVAFDVIFLMSLIVGFTGAATFSIVFPILVIFASLLLGATSIHTWWWTATSVTGTTVGWIATMYYIGGFLPWELIAISALTITVFYSLAWGNKIQVVEKAA